MTIHQCLSHLPGIPHSSKCDRGVVRSVLPRRLMFGVDGWIRRNIIPTLRRHSMSIFLCVSTPPHISLPLFSSYRVTGLQTEPCKKHVAPTTARCRSPSRTRASREKIATEETMDEAVHGSLQSLRQVTRTYRRGRGRGRHIVLSCCGLSGLAKLKVCTTQSIISTR